MRPEPPLRETPAPQVRLLVSSVPTVCSSALRVRTAEPGAKNPGHEACCLGPSLAFLLPPGKSLSPRLDKHLAAVSASPARSPSLA